MADNGFNIQEFKGYIGKTGYLPVNRYVVELRVPPIMSGATIVEEGKETKFNQDFARDLSFRAESIRAPGIAISFDSVNRYGVGPIQKFPFNAQFTDISVNFLADKDSLVWKFFYAWLNNIFQYSNEDGPNQDYTRYRLNYMKDYATDIYIHVYDVDGAVSTNIQLIDAYPISMNDVNLAWDANNQTMKITVTFTFRHWKLKDVKVPNRATAPVPVAPLTITKKATTVQSVKAIAPDPTINHRNQNGLYNNPTIPGGTPQTVFDDRTA